MSFPQKYLWLLCCISLKAFAQQPNGIAGIEKLYEAKNYTAAEQLLNAAVENTTKTRNADSLVEYIIWTGKITNKLQDEKVAVQQANALVEKVKMLTPLPKTIAQAYIEIGEFYGLLSQNENGFKSNEKALQYAVTASDEKRLYRLTLIENNMATYAQRMGDINLSIVHGHKALKWLNQLQKQDYEQAYLVYNSIGTGLYYQSKLDSSLIYFNKAIDALSKAQPTAENRYYRPAIIQNNIAGIYGIQGKATAGIAAMKNTIENLKQFVATKEPHKKKANALEFQLEATDNLAGIYKEIGDYRQAKNLLEYSYEQKKKVLPAGNRGIFISEILLGQLYYAMREMNKAVQYINTGLSHIDEADDEYLFWRADAYNSLALVYDKKEPAKAAIYYEQSDSLYEASLDGEYDNIYLEFLDNAATFYAANKQASTALAKANKGYTYIVKTEGANSLSAAQCLLNLAEVNYLLKNYQQAISYGDKTLSVLNTNIRNSTSLLDSIRTESKKPRAILIRSKAVYQLLPQKNVSNLTPILYQLDAALALLERKKALIDDAGNNSLLLADNAELLEFSKQISYDLYRLTNDSKYIDRLVGLHESGLYNRIRSRLDANDSLRFINVPKDAQATEKRLKAAITNALQGEGSHDEKMKQYLTAVQQWNDYQQTLRTQYPKYYAMRYASVFKSGSQLQKTIPANTSVVRYFYIDTSLYAFVADAQKESLYPLSANGIDKLIEALPQYGQDAAKTGQVLQALYQQLWAPFAATIHHQKVIIIPDGSLYNLSFETLTSQPIHSFNELATKSLLAKYAISYNYSLFLLKGQQEGSKPKENFVAFAPGFTDEIKQGYRNTVRPPNEADREYLTLLPQPFTVNLVNKFSKFFDGKVYTAEASTAANFRSKAGQHRIIHIGTHAEANNLHPEFSRLIFTKNPQQQAADNSLFLTDLYNCDLTADLAVLTACETGRPGYQDGEGMISLAHAFNYAGSQSILTSLWKIDEQASTTITETFYENLAKGMTKDEALRQAKLHYLSTSNGRMLSPQYWAGLVLMGDTSPLQIEKKSNVIWWWAGAGLVLLIAGFAGYRKYYRTNRKQIPV